MPEGMEVRQAVESVEGDARGVEKSTQRNPEYAVPRDRVYQGAHRKHDQPAHSQIYHHGRDFDTLDRETLEDNSQDGKAPHNGEQKPSQLPVQRHEDEWGIGSGYQKIDCRMINDSQHVTRTGADKRVIQRRADIDQHQGTAKNRATDNLVLRDF